MDPNTALDEARAAVKELAQAIENEGDKEALIDAASNLLNHFDALDGWLSKDGALPKAWERTTQILVTLPDRSQVGMYVRAGDADVHLRDNPGYAWDAPLPKADTHHTGTAHVPGTYHIGSW